MKHINAIKRIIMLLVGGMVLSQTAYAQLSGTYTIGGTTPDYADLAAAVTDLNSSGVSGPVVFNMRNGTYTGQVAILNITGASATNTITIQSESGDNTAVIVDFTPISTSNYIIRLENASYVTIKDITVTTTAASHGRLIELTAEASYNRVENCILDAAGTSSTMAGIYATAARGTDNIIAGNTFTSGYYGIYLYGGNTVANMMKNTVIENNIFNNVYYYSTYLYYQQGIKFRNNVINKTDNGTHYALRLYYCSNGTEVENNKILMDGTGTRYGVYCYYSDNSLLVRNNTVSITNSGTAYGMRFYYNDGTAANPGLIFNNTVAIDCGSATAYGLYSYYSTYQNFYNNSISVNSTSATSEAARFYYSSTAYTNNTIRNNVFSSVTSDGTTLYVYSFNPSYNNTWDYNNIHNGKTALVETGSPAATHNTLAAWVVASGQDANSISYDPGFLSTTNLRPDINNAASWSLNGRGVHITGNNRDMDNNPRIELLKDGAPDIGAYEFEPAAAPPLAVATPLHATRGDVQVFTFGQREVATVKWGMTADPSPLEVRQYSGRIAPGISAVNSAANMYFYTDINTLGSNTNHDCGLQVNYMDTWLGTIPNEANLRLAQQVPAYPWMLYSNALSTVDDNANKLSSEKVTRFGLFSGLPNGTVPSAFADAEGSNVICLGSVAKVNAQPLNGNYYKWYLNGSAIAGAEGANYVTHEAKQAGQYSVEVTFGTVKIESVPVVISTIAPPNAIVVANGALTYCTGSGLELDAGKDPGVSYQWQLNGVDIPGAVNAKHVVTEAGNYNVFVKNMGCSTGSPTTIVTPGPLTVSLGNDTSYCEVNNILAKLDAGYPGAKYQWNTGETTQTIEVRNAGTYWVKVDAGPNCAASDSIIVNIDPLPSANGISFVNSGSTYHFSVAAPVDVHSYLWLFSDGTTSTQQAPTKTITGQSLYVRVVLVNACGTDTLQLGYPLDVKNIDGGQNLAVFPNPANENVTIRINGGARINEIVIVNTLGAVVNHLKDLDAAESKINVSSLPSGQYVIRVATTDGVVTKPFTVAR